MFHKGDLQSGIAAAIQQQKLVTCFVHDENQASAEWEQDRLPQINDLLAHKTILLKIKLGSQEAGFLSAFCRLEHAPSIVVIDNGKIVTQLGPETTSDEWEEKMSQALRSRDTVQSTDASATAQAPAVTSSQQAAPQATSAVEVPPAEPPANVSHSLNALMPERAARVEADQADKAAKEKAHRVARAEARRKEIEAAQSNSKGKQPVGVSEPPPKARTDWVREQSKRKQEAKTERERILKAIQSDREERAARSAMLKEASLYAAPEPAKIEAKLPSSRTTTCSLQVRLVDGSSVKRQFQSGQTLKDVRAWVKEVATPESSTPSYVFKQFLAPQPNRNIEPADEDQSLWSNGLTPSATLIVVPIEEPAPVAAGGIIGLLTRILATIFGIFASIFASLTQGRAAVEPAPSSELDSASASGVDSAPKARLRHKTLADSRAEDKPPTEFYNGNSSAFESRKDDDDD